MASPRSKITIYDVAKKGNVSIATVSRVLNKSDLVREETRAVVNRIAKELKYVPNASARSLSTSKTDTIGLLLPDLYGEFFSEVIRGCDQTAQQQGFHVLVSSSHSSREEIEAAVRVMRGRVDGVIIMSPHVDAQTLNENLPHNIRVMLLNCYVDGVSFDSLNIDNYGGAYAMVLHLVGHGHRQIAIIKGTKGNYDANERLRGYRAALLEAFGESCEPLEIDGDFTEASGYDALKKLKSSQLRPTAIFASNDSMAVGALSAMREEGIQIPGEMVLAGFDDVPIASYLTPSLTSVRVGISNLGVLAMRQVLRAVKEKHNHKIEQRLLPTTLIIRESCGCMKKPELLLTKTLWKR